MPGGGPAGGRGMTWRAAIAAAPASILAAAARPSASARRRARSAVSLIPASSPTSFAAAVNGTAAAARSVILASPGDIVCPGHPQLGVAGRQAVPAGSAVIPGPAQRDRAEHGVNGLVPVGDELRLVPGPAPGSRPAVAGVGGQQRLQHRASQLP